jgi:Phosphopantetheine attachment site
MITTTNAISHEEFDDNANATPPGFLSEYNQVMSQWLELQMLHAQANDRFLQTHERVVSSCLANSSELPTTRGLPNSIVQPRLPAAAIARPSDAEAAPVERRRAPLPASPSRPPLPTPKALPPRVVAPTVPRPAPTSTPHKTSEPAENNGPLTNGAAKSAPPPQPPATLAPSAPGAENELLVPPPTAEFQQDLLNAVSERTGYPLDMLKEDALLEADLGIDSIKTVEIFGSLTRYHKFMPGSGGFDEELLSEFAKLKTLGDIVAMYDRGRNSVSLARDLNSASAAPSADATSAATGQNHSSPAPSSSATATSVAEMPTDDRPTETSLSRLELTAVAAPAESDHEKKNSLATISS